MKQRHPISAEFILTVILILVSLIPATSAASPPPQEISERSLVAVYYATQAELDAVGAEYDVMMYGPFMRMKATPWPCYGRMNTLRWSKLATKWKSSKRWQPASKRCWIHGIITLMIMSTI
jgi:hypothetical protein